MIAANASGINANFNQAQLSSGSTGIKVWLWAVLSFSAHLHRHVLKDIYGNSSLFFSCD